MNQHNNVNNFLNTFNQDDLNRQAYQKIIKQKKSVVTCISWSIAYISLFVLFVISLVLLIWLSCWIVNELNADANFIVPLDFWEFLAYPICDFVLLEIIGVGLLIQTKKLKKEYPDKIKNLTIWYWVGLFLTIPSFIVSILIIVICKKLNKEIDENLKTRSYMQV